MKNIILFALLLAVLSPLTGQNRYELQLKNGTYTPSANAQTFAEGFVPSPQQLFEGTYYLVVQFNEIPDEGRRRQLAQSGVMLMDYLPGHAYWAAVREDADLQELVRAGARSMVLADNRFRQSEDLFAGNIPAHAREGDLVLLNVRHHLNVPKDLALRVLSTRFEVREEFRHRSHTQVALPENALDELMRLPFVAYVEPVAPAPTPDDIPGRSLHRSNAINADYGAGRHYDGTGVTIALADDGIIGPHIDYTGRLTDFATSDNGSHGDMTAGILFGAGNRDPIIRGHATGAYLYYWAIGGYPQVVNAVQNYTNYGVVLSSTSYSQGTGGVYTTDTEFIDEQIHSNPQLLHVFSAGNAGTSDHGYGAGAGWGNITGGYKAGKNVITCGNLNNKDALENSSSRGPTDDGRIKPDLCANGFEQLSTAANNTNQVGGGTSAAAPSVAGTTTQLYHAYKSLNGGAEPQSALLKACLQNTAEDLGNPGPDFRHGWGRINALRAVRILEENRYVMNSISQGQNQTHNIVVPAGAAQLRVMIHWSDYQGNPAAAKSLVNDLNMTVTDPGATTWNPWVLDPTPNAANLNTPATRGVDDLNNTEQVTLDNPAAGTYTVTVNGNTIPQGPQTYFLVWEVVEPKVEVTYPLGGEGFVPGETELIRWDAFGTNSTFNVEYSTNGGTSWNTIVNGLAASSRYYEWTVPNNVTGEALVRVSNGALTSTSATTFGIINTPNGITVDYVCPDSIGLSWNAVNGAASYEITHLGQKYMDSVAVSGTTSGVVYGLNPNLAHWFSVTAVLPNGQRGRRAIAIEYAGGTMNCVLPTDIALDDLVSPGKGSLPSCQVSATTPITVEFTNMGTSPVSNIPVSVTVDANAPVNEQIPGPVAPGASASYTFTATANLTAIGSHTVMVVANLAGDGNVYNDTIVSDIEVYNSVTVTLPVAEDFESFASCGTTTNCEAEVCGLGNGWLNLENLTSDDIDWRVDNGGTPSNGTGPNIDHNPGTSQGNYVYLEASGSCEGKVALLMSPCIDLTNASSPLLSYWYHMDGDDMGSLHLDILVDGEWTEDVIFPVSGDQGTSWQNSQVSLGAYVGKVINVRFRGITGAGWSSDLALDDILITESAAAPVANFEADYTSTCPGNTVTMQDMSTNGPSQWAWTITPNTFNYVNGTNANSQNPQVQFTAAGTYTVTLVASNGNGSDTYTRNAYIDINAGVPGNTVAEDFQGAFIPAGWSLLTAGGAFSWAQATAIPGAGGNTTNAAWVENYAYNSPGNEDVLQTMSIDLNAAVFAEVTFDVAYARYSTTLFDGLRIDVSSDCGNTFAPSAYFKEGSDLATVGDQTNSWTPGGAADWRNDTLDLTPYVGNSVVLRFVNINGYGNNLYLDNVNLAVSNGLALEDELVGTASVYPNPGTGEFTLALEGFAGTTAEIMVADLSGHILTQQQLGLQGGYYHGRLDLRHLAAGVYMLKINAEGHQQVKRVVIQ